MDRHCTPADRQIEEAMERGEFDNLPGKGKPLDLSTDPLLDPMTAIVYRILRDNGVSHPLIEARKVIEKDAGEARREISRAWEIYRQNRSEDTWHDAIQAFRERVKAINREIRLFNLKAPSPAFHGLIIDVDRELARIEAGSDPASSAASNPGPAREKP
ncbi:MAG TPA: DnaJ family domain-containing protein [Bryobacteraceae bacterium]|nr:DnaJ family domain-containing protein [Bryobacteraceae bacterium]